MFIGLLCADFYSSREHATNVGIMFRGVDNALQPNWYVVLLVSMHWSLFNRHFCPGFIYQWVTMAALPQ